MPEVDPTLLNVTSLGVGYSNKQVIKAVTIDVKPGEVVALIGPNGAGKSTILKAIFGLSLFGRERSLSTTEPCVQRINVICFALASLTSRKAIASSTI